MKTLFSHLLNSLITPLVSQQTRELLQFTRDSLPSHLDGERQFIGRQYVGCGATIGVMPRCDFACRGCYLGQEANRIPYESLSGIKQQLDRIRLWLGEGGNVQITDGEATLRPEHELIEMIRYAREIGLVPMLMTHGDSLRKSPQLIKRLMLQGGLSEISIHIDSTQRGRFGEQYKNAQNEWQLMPLRDEFAQLLQQLRAQSGRKLEAAMTYTVTDNNIEAVSDVVRWALNNANAFKMLSLQPVAQVGRTEKGLNSEVSVERLWNLINNGLAIQNDERTSQDYRYFGHPDCTRFVQGVVLSRNGASEFHPLFHLHDQQALELINSWCAHFGGISFRRMHRLRKIYSLLRILLQKPKFLLLDVMPLCLRRLREIDGRGSMHFLFDYLAGKTQMHYLSIVSHHFMNSQQIHTARGQERLNACVFKVPINNEMVSMCEVNALNHRSSYYAALANSRKEIN